jgi:hypothetical protein
MSDNTKQLMFSLITGEIYTILSDELKVMDEYQVPLKQKPQSNCSKCYGRLYIGKDHIHQLYIMCPKCSIKCIDTEKIKSLIVPSNQSIDSI